MNQEFFEYRNDGYYCEGLSVEALAKEYGTPLYIYSASHLKARFAAFEEALKDYPHQTCFAVKACSNLAVLKLLAAQGAGFDIVSGGELYRVRKAGGDTRKCVYAGVGKSEEEIRFALECGILYFSVESVPELARIDRIAGEMGLTAPVAVRVNPDVDAHTHAYITTGKSENKFGLNFAAARALYLAMGKEYPHVAPRGVQMHIGSQITETTPFVMAVGKLADFVQELKAAGVSPEYFDIGGGLGIVYDDETPATPAQLWADIAPRITALGMKFVCEMGRNICGNSAVLAARVEYVKENPDKTFVITDAAMNDLMRPALYGAYHELSAAKGEGDELLCDVVGPVCESGDFFGKDRRLARVQEGDIVIAHSAGAYGFSMSSNYNTRNRAAEVLVEGGQARLIRRRETWEDQLRNEEI